MAEVDEIVELAFNADRIPVVELSTPALRVMSIWLPEPPLEPTWKVMVPASPFSSFLPFNSVLSATRLISFSIDWNSPSSALRSL
ncbi:hypothetical protein D3C81_1488090 [compost metagenome]